MPVFNEARALPALLEKIRGLDEKLDGRVVVIAVDDGSRDATPSIIRDAGNEMEVICVTHPANEGLRKTMQDGYDAAVRIAAPDDVVVTMDGDDTQDPAYIKTMIEKLDEGYDVVIASRYRKGSRVMGVPLLRRVFSLGANLLCRVFLHIDNIRDYACGFRVFRGRLLKDCLDRYGDGFLGIKGYGFICSVEAIVKAASLGAAFAEVPFELRYDRREGQSKMRPGRTILGYFVLVWRSRAMKKSIGGR